MKSGDFVVKYKELDQFSYRINILAFWLSIEIVLSTKIVFFLCEGHWPNPIDHRLIQKYLIFEHVEKPIFKPNTKTYW